LARSLIIKRPMSWKRRILELSLAGGMLAGAGCGNSGPTFLCNANPDPCCSAPDSQACHDYQNRDLSVTVQDMTTPDMTSHD
jgi:hypothetical protein